MDADGLVTEAEDSIVALALAELLTRCVLLHEELPAARRGGVRARV
jgi:hypothetical protein